MTTPTTLPNQSSVVSGTVRCDLTGQEVNAADAYWAPPLVTLGELLATIADTARSNPSQLGQVLFAEQPNVPFAPEARELLARRRSTEQAKLLGIILLVLLLVTGLVLLVAMG